MTPEIARLLDETAHEIFRRRESALAELKRLDSFHHTPQMRDLLYRKIAAAENVMLAFRVARFRSFMLGMHGLPFVGEA